MEYRYYMKIKTKYDDTAINAKLDAKVKRLREKNDSVWRIGRIASRYEFSTNFQTITMKTYLLPCWK